MKKSVRISIPDDIDFSDLRLARDQDGSVSLDLSVIERICDASGIPISRVMDAPEDTLCSLVVTWYQVHLEHGGDRDPVADDLIAEAVAEELAGQGESLPPGRA